jgi:DNA-binding NarL/FixJ family response regulator
MMRRKDEPGEEPRTVRLRIEDAALADRVAAILERRADIVLYGGTEADVIIVDHTSFDPLAATLVLAEGTAALEAVRAGAQAVLARSCTEAELALAIEALTLNLSVVPQGMLGSATSAASREAGAEDLEILTSREREVLQLLGEGASNKEIARRLDISVHTAKFHVASIAAKLDATGRTDAVAQAVRRGLML